MPTILGAKLVHATHAATHMAEYPATSTLPISKKTRFVLVVHRHMSGCRSHTAGEIMSRVPRLSRPREEIGYFSLDSRAYKRHYYVSGTGTIQLYEEEALPSAQH